MIYNLNQIDKEFNIDFKEIYAVIILYYSTFSINENKYIPKPNIPNKLYKLFTPQRKKAIENIYLFTKQKTNYIPFLDFSIESESEEEIIEKEVYNLFFQYKNATKIKKQHTNFLIYNENTVRIFALFNERIYTFNKLAEKVYEYLDKYLSWYELSNEDLSNYNDLIIQDKNKIEKSFETWYKKQNYSTNYNDILYGLTCAKELIKIDILGNTNKKILLMAQDYFNFQYKLKYILNINKFNKIKKAYYIYLDYLDSKEYILKLAKIDWLSKEELNKDFRETFNSFFKKGLYYEKNNSIPGKFIQ